MLVVNGPCVHKWLMRSADSLYFHTSVTVLFMFPSFFLGIQTCVEGNGVRMFSNSQTPFFPVSGPQWVVKVCVVSLELPFVFVGNLNGIDTVIKSY